MHNMSSYFSGKEAAIFRGRFVGDGATRMAERVDGGVAERIGSKW
ncbi:hypothetical protein Leryth_019730 [Lithospermum erythrorhizon]|nr:hypothetical protein Leryth_019730 [Lithospermum erythrorhizon]